MSDLVTVVIPTFNRRAYVGEAIRSVLSQTYSPIEIIVVDDGSTDQTGRFIATTFPEVHYVWQQNAERSVARNHGLRLAAGRFTAFLDSDDQWAPDKISADVAALERFPECGFAYSDIEVINHDGSLRRVVRKRSQNGWVTQRLLLRNFVSMSANCTVTSLFRKAGGFSEDLSFSEDWEAWVRLSTITQFIHVPHATTKMRQHATNSVKERDVAELSSIAVCEVFEQAEYLTAEHKELLPKTRAWIALSNALRFAEPGSRARAFEHIRTAFRHDPVLLFDPHFLYTALRIVLGPVVSDTFYKIHRVCTHRASSS